MGFIMDGLDAEAYDRSYSDGELVRRISAYFRPYTRRMLTVAAMVVLSSVMGTATPIIISRGIDTLTATPNLQLVVGLVALVALFGFMGWLFNYLRQLRSAQAVGDVVLAIRQDAFEAVTKRDMSFYDEFASGKIVSRVTNDTYDFSSVVTLTIDLVSQLLLVVIVTIVMIVVNLQLGLIVLAIGPVVIVLALLYRRVARWATRRAQRAIANVNASIQETISGIAVAKSFRQESAIYREFLETNRLAYRVRLRQGWVMSTIFPSLNTISGIGVAIVVYFGGLRVLNGAVSVGEWYLFVQSLSLFFFPLTSIASFWSQFQQGLSASERVFALIDAEPRVVQHDNQPIGALQGDIRFEDVWFSYDTSVGDGLRPIRADNEGAGDQHSTFNTQNSNWVLHGFDLHIKPGEKLAIVGHTGAGKSSLIKLITRFYEFQGGRILVDDQDLRDLDLAQYRRQIGLVPQVPFLFSGTVASNIRYGNPNADDDAVLAAAHRLGGGDWIEGLPQGLDSDVGERGSRLSFGQRQLVALARVVLQSPAIFILDEATASIDPFTEAQIQEGLDIVMEERTSIIIAHRLSTVRSADRIIVMRAGQIIEEGNHDGLMQQAGHYAELYNTYFRHQSLDYRPWEA